MECVRRGSSRADVPLSAFAPSPEEPVLNATFVAQHILRLFEYAADIVPAMYHATTHATYQATAGMRLLDEDDQEAVYDALYEGLVSSKTFVFSSLKRSDIATLSGELEGFYGAIAANYLTGIIDANLHTIRKTKSKIESLQALEESVIAKAAEEEEHHGPIGALDMGGSSTQIVFMPGTATTNDCNDVEWDRASCGNEDAYIAAEDAAAVPAVPQRLNGDEFFSTSYLSYGVDQFRERLWNSWIQERQEQDGESCDSRILKNPCAFKGYAMEWEGYTLVGTGDTDECIRQVQRLIPHAPNSKTTPLDDALSTDSLSVTSQEGRRVVGGVEHPPVRGKFFAMSLYFFTLDSLRVLSEPHHEAHMALNLSWPRPSLEELHNALYGLCSRNWYGDLYEIQHNSHQYTRAEVLPHRCFESVYMVTLLRDGFGFDPSARDITFTFLVDGSEVEWSLGMALALHADRRDLAKMVAAAPSSFQDTHLPNRHQVDTNLTTEEEDEEDECCDCGSSQTCPEIF